jgi:hypothetical protein
VRLPEQTETLTKDMLQDESQNVKQNTMLETTQTTNSSKMRSGAIQDLSPGFFILTSFGDA